MQADKMVEIAFFALIHKKTSLMSLAQRLNEKSFIAFQQSLLRARFHFWSDSPKVVSDSNRQNGR